MSGKSAKKKGGGTERVKCFVRVRPQHSREIGENIIVDVKRDAPNLQKLVLAAPIESNARDLNGAQVREFPFDGIFDMGTSTEEVYENVCFPIVQDVLNGFNGTIMGYGQTSSGKTHTLFRSADGRTPGVAVLAVQDIFKQIAMDVENEYAVTCSYVQIYNEHIQDLLSDSDRNLPIREHPQEGVYVEHLNSFFVTCEEDVMQLLERGRERAVFGETKLNVMSSRSHTLIQLTVQKCKSKSLDNIEPSGAMGEMPPATHAADRPEMSPTLRPVGTPRSTRSDASGMLSPTRHKRTMSDSAVPPSRAVFARAAAEVAKTRDESPTLTPRSVDSGGTSDAPSATQLSTSRPGPLRLNSITLHDRDDASTPRPHSGEVSDRDHSPHFDHDSAPTPGGEVMREALAAAEQVLRGKLLIVDLAGSERAKRSGSEGLRFDEAKHINSSLSTLGICISALASSAPHVPFRDCKLTRLLENSLTGNSKTSLIVCVAPSEGDYFETLSSLRFGERAMSVVTHPSVNREIDFKSLCTILKQKAKQREKKLVRMILEREEKMNQVHSAAESLKEAYSSAFNFLRGSIAQLGDSPSPVDGSGDLLGPEQAREVYIRGLEDQNCSALEEVATWKHRYEMSQKCLAGLLGGQGLVTRELATMQLLALLQGIERNADGGNGSTVDGQLVLDTCEKLLDLLRVTSGLQQQAATSGSATLERISGALGQLRSQVEQRMMGDIQSFLARPEVQSAAAKQALDLVQSGSKDVGALQKGLSTLFAVQAAQLVEGETEGPSILPEVSRVWLDLHTDKGLLACSEVLEKIALRQKQFGAFGSPTKLPRSPSKAATEMQAMGADQQPTTEPKTQKCCIVM